MKNETLETALLLSSIGLPMFECRGKVPAAKEWQAATSPEPQTAATWQSYGLACGRNSGFWVLDIDTKNGQPGLQNLTALEAEYGPLPATMVVETPSGGRHYYFRFEEGLRIANRAGDIAAGVDVRGHDEAGEPLGYVCGPGSQLENGSYRVVSGFDLFPAGLPAAPDWLLFLANFNKRDREKLAELGIHGAKDFAGAPPKAWKALAGKFLSLTRPERKASGEAPAPVSGDAALNYVKAAIEGLLSDLVAEAADNHRNEPANITALHIHGDLKGAIEKGADIGAVADLEHWAHAEFLAVCQGIEFEADKPNPEKLAEDLWQRCKHDAKPRNLDHVGRKTADATSQFGALPHSIEGTSAPVSRFKFIDDEPPIKSIDWLVDDLIPAKSFGFIAGASGSGKSAVALDLAMSLAAGTPFFGRSIPKAGA